MLWIARCGNKSILIGGCSSCTYLCSELLDNGIERTARVWIFIINIHVTFTAAKLLSGLKNTCIHVTFIAVKLLSDVEKHVHTCDLCCCQTAFWPEKHLHTWPLLLPNCFLTWKTLTQCDLYSYQTAFWPEKHIHTCDLYCCQTAFWCWKTHTWPLLLPNCFLTWKTLTHMTFIAAKLLSDLKNTYTMWPL